jgi:hypothetical protein
MKKLKKSLTAKTKAKFVKNTQSATQRCGEF